MADLDIKTRAAQAISRVDEESAFDLVKEIDAVLAQIKDANDLDYQRYFALRQQLFFVALRYLSEASIEDLFEQSSATIMSLPEDFDLVATIKHRLRFEFFIDDRNRLRDKWRAAMLRCRDRLGTANIRLGESDVSPTVENWLKVYTADVGSGRPTTVKVARFFAQNPAVQTLKADEKKRLKRLIALFEFFKARSDDLSGFEETLIVSDENGKSFFLGDGKFTEVLDAASIEALKARKMRGELALEDLARLSRAYPEHFPLDSTYKPSSAAITSYTPENLASRAQQFLNDQRAKFSHRVPASGVPLPNRTAALVAMLHKAMSRGQEADMVLAKEILQFVLADNERFINFMRHQSILTLLQNELPVSIGEKNKPVVRQSPTSPMALQAMLQIVFSKFKLSPEEVAWQSFDTIQRLPMQFKDLKTIVTYDPGQNSLVWRYG